jgi:hypothetical protein
MKFRLFLLLSIISFSQNIYAAGAVTAGNYISLKDSNSSDYYEPGYYYALGSFNKDLNDNLYIDADLFFRYGKPDSRAEMLYSSYYYNHNRFLLQYTNSSFKIGSITQYKYSKPDKDFSFIQYNRVETISGINEHSLAEEFFVEKTFMEKLTVDATATYYQEHYNNTSASPNEKEIDRHLKYSAGASYKLYEILQPFTSLEINNFLNEDKKNIIRKDLHAGIKGEYLSASKNFKFEYKTYYKYLESDFKILSGPVYKYQISENDRGVISFRTRYNTPIDLDLFAWLYHEYSYDDQNELRYVNRTVCLFARQWIVANTFNIGVGSTVQIEKDDDGLYYPLWPYVESNLSLKNFSAFVKYLRIYDKINQQKNKLKQTKLSAGTAYFFNYFKLQAEFYYSDYEISFVNSYGVDLSATALF